MANVKLEYSFTYTHQNQSEVFPHQHNSYELVYYFEGNGISHTDECDYTYDCNSYSIYAPNIIHSEYHFEKTTVFCIGFSIDLNSNTKITTGNYSDIDNSILSIVDQIRKESIQHQTHFNDLINLLLSQFLLIFDRENNKDGQKYDELYGIKKYINENLEKDSLIGAIAGLSGYSYHYFRHIFKEQTGLSPKQYIINRRIEYAKNLLANSPATILNIAQSCGFSCSSQFDIIFKRYTGLTPMQYRKKT